MNHKMKGYELNVDGLVGTTHNYAGLGIGNVASIKNAHAIANPKQAALQGLEKMRFLHELGLKQAFFPPHLRPNLELLHNLGFTGDIPKQLKSACNFHPKLLAAVYSASSMWAANTATTSTSFDTLDGKVHFTVANLIKNLHRHHESQFAHKLLKMTFPDEKKFVHHKVLPRTSTFSDEGAANHSRLCKNHYEQGLNIFTYGSSALNNKKYYPKKFPARQTVEAQKIIAQNHQIKPRLSLFIQQNPYAIDMGVFHNDVIAVANEYLLLLHEKAFVNQKKVLADIVNMVDFEPYIIEIKEKDLSIQDAVDSYLFNSQIVTLPDNSMLLLAPIECEQNDNIKNIIHNWLNDSKNPIQKVQYFDLKQSMQNGGGPACLRLRVVLTPDELQSINQNMLLNDKVFQNLKEWIHKHYRDKLTDHDLLDPGLVDESFKALDELTQILKLGNIYSFQR